jgi:hypothetical protein
VCGALCRVALRVEAFPHAAKPTNERTRADSFLVFLLSFSLYPRRLVIFPSSNRLFIVRLSFVHSTMHSPINESSTHSTPTIYARFARAVGTNNTYLSIYESNSSDNTPTLLTTLSASLTTLGIRHRIISEKTGGRSWPHGASEARIAYLAKARNRALEPLSSEDPEVRLPDGEGWEEGKVVFLNDVVFEAEQVVQLLESRVEGEEDEEYDLACGVDFGWSGE